MMPLRDLWKTWESWGHASKTKKRTDPAVVVGGSGAGAAASGRGGGTAADGDGAAGSNGKAKASSSAAAAPASAEELRVDLRAALCWSAACEELGACAFLPFADPLWQLTAHPMASHFHSPVRFVMLTSLESLVVRHTAAAGEWLCRAGGRRQFSEILRLCMASEARVLHAPPQPPQQQAHDPQSVAGPVADSSAEGAASPGGDAAAVGGSSAAGCSDAAAQGGRPPSAASVVQMAEEAGASGADASGRLRVLCGAWLLSFRALLLTAATPPEAGVPRNSFHRGIATFTYDEKHRALTQLMACLLVPDPAHVRARANAHVATHLRGLLERTDLSGADMPRLSLLLDSNGPLGPSASNASPSGTAAAASLCAASVRAYSRRCARALARLVPHRSLGPTTRKLVAASTLLPSSSSSPAPASDPATAAGGIPSSSDTGGAESDDLLHPLSLACGIELCARLLHLVRYEVVPPRCTSILHDGPAAIATEALEAMQVRTRPSLPFHGLPCPSLASRSSYSKPCSSRRSNLRPSLHTTPC